MRTAIFVGSFDPFTIGHDDIARRALALVDRLVIGVGVNERKACSRTAEERISAIRQLYADEPRIEVVGFSDLTVTLAQRVGAQFVVKGVRSLIWQPSAHRSFASWSISDRMSLHSFLEFRIKD